jgi:hypothetical protein
MIALAGLFMVASLSSCEDLDVGVEGVCPLVVSTNPSNLATNVPLNQVMTVTFNEDMDPETITLGSISFVASPPIAGTLTYSNKTATFTPTNLLLANTTYTGTVSRAVKNMTGNALQEPYVWTFSTGAVLAPTITSTDPVNLETDVAVAKVVSAVFSQVMDPATITGSSFTLRLGTDPIAGAVSYNGSTASFTPTNDLAPGTYTARISTLAKNPDGTALEQNYVWSFSTEAAVGPGGVNLESAEFFGILAGVGISNNAGFSEIRNLDVGISPGVRSSITGFPPAIVVNGAIYASDDLAPPGVAAMLTQAKEDLTNAYLYAEGATFPAPATVSGDLGGTTLAPGIYKSTSTLLIQSGDLTLDAQGDPNAVWIFQIASAFTTVGGAGGSIILSGGANANNIFWQTGSSATIGDGTSFKGNILALTSITMNSGATATGRMLARNGSVVMTNTNIIEKP